MIKCLPILLTLLLIGCGEQWSATKARQKVVEQYGTAEVYPLPTEYHNHLIVRDRQGAIWFVELETNNIDGNINQIRTKTQIFNSTATPPAEAIRNETQH